MALPPTNASAAIRTLIADDEPLARELLGNLVRRDPQLHLVASAASGAETLRAVEQYQPALLLLDVQMPNLDGISVAEQLADRPHGPYVIFVTAHDRFALQAFEVAVRDYLVKPIAKRRFEAAIRRAKQELLGAPPATVSSDEGLRVRSGDLLLSVKPQDLIWVEAANQYVRLHTVGGDSLIVAQSLRRFTAELTDPDFLRIHRSTLINQQHLVAVRSVQGRYRVELRDGSQHDVARNRRALVPALLERARENRPR